MEDKTKDSKNKNIYEVIECPVCGNKISTPKSLRCPRCFASIIKPGCGGNCSRCAEKC